MGKKPHAWDDPFEFDGDDASKQHLSRWEDQLSNEVMVDAHEALTKLYTKTSKRKGDGRLKRMRNSYD